MKDVFRLAVDARDLASDTRGIGRYTRAILRRLVQREDIELTLLVLGVFPFVRRKALRATLGSDRFRIANRANGCDAIWHPSNGTFFTGDTPSVVTIHDAVPFRFPDTDLKRREHQQAPFLRSIQSAARVIAVSEFDRSELLDVFSLPPYRIDVIYHGVDLFFSPATANEHSTSPLPQPYLLFVGNPVAEPRKNFALLHQAHRRAFAASSGPQLAVVGPRDPQIEGVRYAGLAGSDVTGQGDARLRSLYRHALALCVPSYYETFGMPLAEAMACGTPVIASRASCLPEIGGDAAYYVPPHDVEAWTQALREVADNTELRERLRDAGLVRAARYNWDESARRHAEVFFNL